MSSQQYVYHFPLLSLIKLPMGHFPIEIIEFPDMYSLALILSDPVTNVRLLCLVCYYSIADSVNRLCDNRHTS